jgi:predicted transcriptional regulator
VKKTTIELPDELADQARRCAAAGGTTMRSLIEDALRREIERRSEAAAWTPRADLVFTGKGLTDEAAVMSWAQIRELANERSPRWA